MQRREFFKNAIRVAGGAAAATIPILSKESDKSFTVRPVDNRKVSRVAFPQKRPLITYSDRPPLLETPREVFTSKITPNDLFFVRWHMPMIPTDISPHAFRLHIEGEVQHEINLSLNKLKEAFESVEITAVVQCGGNNRTAFNPTAGGIQWGIGAMGCARWKGVRLKEVLQKAGLKQEAGWISFNGLEKPVYVETESFVRALPLEKLHDDVILAYEMNGEDLPYLNGYPLRLIIPGTYSDSWIKMISNIRVSKEKPVLHFMEHAYRIPDNDCECETPDHLAAKTKPIEEINVNSVIGYPLSGTKVRKGDEVIVRGVAFDGGHGIAKVEISTDEGVTWQPAKLDDGTQGPYAYRAFSYPFVPQKYTETKIWCRATNSKGETQPFPHEIKWNRGGYKYNGIDEVRIKVVS